MPTYHIDPVNGNDANTGLSWAQAWRTFTTGATAARIAPGDDIKVAKTAAPVSIGTATWTDGKVGNSVTFAAAPTKLIDAAKSGWVTMGAGSTVTNLQTVAYMTPVSYGSTSVGCLRWVTSSSANGCYKDLGSDQDFSAHQQISFWFRTTSAFDCTGAQNLIVELCSDAAATTVVNSMTIEKWSYAANTWYPLVINNGAALGSAIRSIRFRTTSATSQTFYVDEIFASPANGITLRSLIGLNNGAWYAIRSIRNADVSLLASFSASDAIGATATNQLVIDAAWLGTTQTATTWKLDPSLAFNPTTGPTSTSYLVNNLEAASTSLPRRITGGWNTSTDIIDGETWGDGVAQQAVAFFSVNNAFTVVENFGAVRYLNVQPSSSADNFFMHNSSAVACLGWPSVAINQGAWVKLLNILNVNIKCATGMQSFNPYGVNPTSGFTSITVGEIWGVGGSSFGTGVSVAPGTGGVNYGRYTLGHIGCIGNASFSALQAQTPVQIKTGRIVLLNSAFSTSRQASLNLSSGLTLNAEEINLALSATSNPAGAKIYTNNLNLATSTQAILAAGGTDTVIFAQNTNIACPIFSSASNSINQKVYFHNWQGTPGDFRVYVCDLKLTTPGYFELQGVDVFTAGSKAVRYAGIAYIATDSVIGARMDLKLASAAAEANKLVTVTARVKRNSANVNAGIYIPGFDGYLPGYTDDISTSVTSVGSWDLVTVTFTPTQNCVFDVFAWLTPTGAVTPNVVWDALTISQAA